MKTADFAAHLTEFLSHYLPELKISVRTRFHHTAMHFAYSLAIARM